MKRMDKKTTIENLARAAHEKGGFTGVWLYAEKVRSYRKAQSA